MLHFPAKLKLENILCKPGGVGFLGGSFCVAGGLDEDASSVCLICGMKKKRSISVQAEMLGSIAGRK